MNIFAVGRNLRAIRKLRGFSQAHLGSLVGITGQMIQKYETGQSEVSSKMLSMLAGKLGVDIRQFFDESGGFIDLSEDGQSYEVDLDEQTRELIRAYAQLSKDDKERLIAVATAFINLKKLNPTQWG